MHFIRNYLGGALIVRRHYTSKKIIPKLVIDPSKASYYSNKSAALIGLGRLIEAVFDCRVAIRINPMYQRAHQRLAKLYLRYALHHLSLTICNQ